MARKVRISKTGNTTIVQWFNKVDESDIQQRNYNEPCDIELIKDTNNFVVAPTKLFPAFQFTFEQIDNPGTATTAQEYLDYAAENFFFYQE